MYVPSHEHPRAVLRGLDHLLLANDLSESVRKKLEKLATEGNKSVKFRFGKQALVQCN